MMSINDIANSKSKPLQGLISSQQVEKKHETRNVYYAITYSRIEITLI